jgi:hypothetical protein
MPPTAPSPPGKVRKKVGYDHHIFSIKNESRFVWDFFYKSNFFWAYFRSSAVRGRPPGSGCMSGQELTAVCSARRASASGMLKNSPQVRFRTCTSYSRPSVRVPLQPGAQTTPPLLGEVAAGRRGVRYSHNLLSTAASIYNALKAWKGRLL